MKEIQKQLFIDLEKCTGCRMCEMVCSLEKEKECSRSSSRIKVAKIDAALDVPIVCFQCEEPLCQEKCPVKAITRDVNGALIIDSEKCISCKICVTVCPIGAIWFDTHKKRILKCDLCHGDPACVKFCQPKAIMYLTKDGNENTEKQITTQRTLKSLKKQKSEKQKETRSGKG